MTDQQLHVFCNSGEEWFVAIDRADLLALLNEMGYGYDESDLESVEQCPDDAMFGIWVSNDTGKIAEEDESSHLETRTFRAWADEYGRGYLAGVNI